MILVRRALATWYGGWGQTLVIATCPLIVGPILLSLLFHAPKWTPRCRHSVYKIERSFVDTLSLLQKGILFCRRIAMNLARGLERLSFPGPKWVQFWGRVVDRPEAKALPRWNKLNIAEQDSIGWDRPAHLWRRITLAPPIFWVLVALLCSLVTVVYVLSLGAIVHYGGVLPPSTGGEGEGIADAPGFILSLWFAAFGLLLSAGNFVSVLAIPAQALCARAVWLTVRQKWVKTKREELRTLAGRVKIYDNGEITASSTFLEIQAFFSRVKRLWSDIERGWSMGGIKEVITIVRSVMARRDREGAAGVAQHQFFALRRKRGEWRVTLPRRASEDKTSWDIRVRRPSTKKLEEIGIGEWRVVQEGDIVTFGGNEEWYVLVERVYP